jgi:hypothetical protein
MAIDNAKLAYWNKQVAAWRASGLSCGAFCEREALKLTTFDYWRTQLAAAGQGEAKPVKAPAQARAITLVAAKPIQARPMPTPMPIQLKSERWELSLPASIEAQWLSALLRALS